MSAIGRVSNTFATYQEKKQQRREMYINAYLVVARKSRQKYDYVTDLAKAVANHISVTERREKISESECNPSTLLRNKRYKALLLSYLAEHAAKGIKDPMKNTMPLSPSDQSNALHAAIEGSNLRTENQRLKYFIAELESTIAAKTITPALVGEVPVSPTATDNLAEMEFKFVSTCQVVSSILNKLQDVLTADIDKRQILDAAIKRGDNVIVDERLAAPFFDWLKKHPANV